MIKQKYGNVIDDNLLQQILVDDNPQRKAEVLASIDEAIKMQEKGIPYEEIINIMKNTTRTKQAEGGNRWIDIMSEIKKYKKYLNFKANPRYLTRDFIVPLYTGTEPDILDDSDTQRESSVYKEFPNDMPIISPKRIQNKPYEQLELADGGRVDIKNKILNAYTKLKKDLGRNPSLAEMNRETGSTRQTIYSYLGNKKLSEGRLVESGKTGTAASVEAFKAREVDKPTSTYYEGKLGVKWPDKKTEERYIKQIKERYQYPAQSFEFNQKVKSGELLTDKGLAKEFGISNDSVERINRYIKNTENLSYPKIGIPELEKEKRERRKAAEKKSSDPAYEQKIRGTKQTQKSHMGDLYNVKVTPQTIGYAPQEVNLALTGKVDPALKSIIEKQNKLYKNKPENYKQRIEDLNVKGMDYAAQTEGYKVFEALDPKTGKRFVPITSPEKTIDPLGIAGETPLKNLTQEQKAQIELNRKAVMESQAKIPASEKRRLVQMIGSIGCPTFASGGRINFSEGSDCFNKGLKALEEGNLTKPQLNVAGRAIAESGEEGMLLKNILSKAGTGFKFTGRGVGELISIGSGPIGVGLGAAVETAFAAPYLLEGDYKQALRQSIFGQVPALLGVDVGSRDEDIIKLAKDAGVDPNSVKKYVELKKNYIENEEYGQKLNMLDEMYKRDPKNLDYVQQIKRLENKIKPSSDYLEKNVYSPKDLSKYEEDYFKAAKYFVDKNAEKALVTRSEEQKKSSLKDIVEESSSAIREPEDVQNILKRKNLLPQEPETNPQEELPSEYKVSAAEGGYIDYMRDFNTYARGGRIHLSEGGKGPKIGRRGFLGFLVGAASAPFVGKLMKGKKTVQAAKVAGKVLPKVSGMPEWFSPLVSKIQKEGIDVSPKATRVEDIIKVKKLEVPAPDGKSNDIITMTEYPDGRIDIEANVYGGAFDSPFSLEYRPPRSDINLDTGAEIKSPGDFTVVEQRPRPESGNPGKIEIDYESMSVDDTISDLERLEKIGTGKRIHPKRVEQRAAARKYIEDNPHEDVVNRYPDGEIYYDQMRDEGLLDE
jgi:hypothetical protein